eukprot:scaffold8884_cov44-Attheya_sp.AAC.3
MPTKKLNKGRGRGAGDSSAAPPKSSDDSSKSSEKMDRSDVEDGAIVSSDSVEDEALFLDDDEWIRTRVDLYAKESIETYFPTLKGHGKRNPPVAVRGCSGDYKVVFRKIREWRQMTEEEQEDGNLTHSKKERDRRFFRDNIWNFTQTANKLKGVSVKVEKSGVDKVKEVTVEEKEKPIPTRPKETDVQEKKTTKQPSLPNENSNDGEKKATIPVAPMVIAPAKNPPKMATPPVEKIPSTGPTLVPEAVPKPNVAVAVPNGAVAVPNGAVPNVAVPNGAVPNGAVPNGVVPNGAVPMAAGGIMAAGAIRSPLPQTVQGTFPLIWARTVLDPVSGTHTIIVPPQQFPGIRKMPPLLPMPMPPNSTVPPLSYQILLSPHPNPMAAMAAMGMKPPIDQNLMQQQQQQQQQQNKEKALGPKGQQRLRNEQLLKQQKDQHQNMLQQQQFLQQMKYHQMTRNNLQKGQQYQVLQQQQQQQQHQLAQQQKGQESSVNQQNGQEKQVLQKQQQQGKEPNLNQHHLLQLQQQQILQQQQQGLQPRPNVNQQNLQQQQQKQQQQLLQQPKPNQEKTQQQQNMLPPQHVMHLQHLQRLQQQKEQQQNMTEQQKMIHLQQQQMFFHQQMLHQQKMQQQLPPRAHPPTVIDALSNVGQLSSSRSPSISPILTPTIEDAKKESTVAKVEEKPTLADSGASNKSKPGNSKTPVSKVVKGEKSDKSKPTAPKEVIDNDSGAANKSKPGKSKTPVSKVVKGGKSDKSKPTVPKGKKVTKLQAPVPDTTSTESKSRRGKPMVPTVKKKEPVQTSAPTRSRKRKSASPATSAAKSTKSEIPTRSYPKRKR